MRDDVTIRMAGPADATALRALQELEDRRLPDGDVLVAEVDGEPRAALPVMGGRGVGDPFRPTAELLELLAVHAEQLRTVRLAPAHRSARRPAVAPGR